MVILVVQAQGSRCSLPSSRNPVSSKCATPASSSYVGFGTNTFSRTKQTNQCRHADQQPAIGIGRPRRRPTGEPLKNSPCLNPKNAKQSKNLTSYLEGSACFCGQFERRRCFGRFGHIPKDAGRRPAGRRFLLSTPLDSPH